MERGGRPLHRALLRRCLLSLGALLVLLPLLPPGPRDPTSFSAQDGSALRMNRGYAIEETAVCRTPMSFIAEVGEGKKQIPSRLSEQFLELPKQ